MPEYLAPGVYIEETSFRAKSIEGVSTTTTGFIGPTRFGPIDLPPEIITSLGEFERMFGDRQQLQYGSDTMHNYMWHAVRAFFEEGGKRLYVVRAFSATDTDPGSTEQILTCCATKTIPAAAAPADQINVRARFPGEMGNMRVRFELRVGQNILGGRPLTSPLGGLQPTVAGLRENDVVWIGDVKSPVTLSSPLAADRLFIARRYFDTSLNDESWQFVRPNDSPVTTYNLGTFQPDTNPRLGDQIRVLTLAVTVTSPDGSTQVWDNLALDPAHTTNGAPDSLSAYFDKNPANSSLALTLPIVITLGENIRTNGLQVLKALFPTINEIGSPIAPLVRESDAITIVLDGGSDGVRPNTSAYEGKDDPDTLIKTGLKAFEDIEDISIIAAPGSTSGYQDGDANRSRANTIISYLISHAERMRYRIAVLDSGDVQSISQVRAMRARFDSKYAALYYPWIRILDPVTQKEIHIPPSGSVSGIYARNDINRAVWKAPANEIVNVALGFEVLLNKAQQDVLNPEGINAFRFFEGRGFRLWGARTISSDPEWKYVNLRRYFIYLERSIDRGTQWAVFEPNGEQLWANVRSTISDFLLSEWQQGALLGDRPEKAFFVRCDRSTMTQNDLDNGRLVCLIGVAPLRPAEFVIFRIGQWTADRRV
jgi:uncharacterized protein